MPPFVGRKRLVSTPPPEAVPTSTTGTRGSPAGRERGRGRGGTRQAGTRPVTARSPALPPPRKKARLADILDDAESSRPSAPAKSKTFQLASDSDSDFGSSALSDLSSDQFEDVDTKTASTKQGNTRHTVHKPNHSDEEEDDDDDDDDDGVVWEDTSAHGPAITTKSGAISEAGPASREIKDIQITIRRDDDGGIDYDAAARAATGGKKGPTKREKTARTQTHQMHVQFLLWHNAIRNRWVDDKRVQEILVKQLPVQIAKEVEKWKRASGLTVPDQDEEEAGSKSQSKGGVKRKGKGKEKEKRRGRKGKKDESERAHRDWGPPSNRLEVGRPDLSHGDPLTALLRVLAAYWKKRFSITAPGLRKRGYGTKQALKQEIASYRNEVHNPVKHGEVIKTLDEFRQLAEKCHGSRDVGAQLFTGLLRGLGIEARLVASLQPAGYGWTKAEQMVPRKVDNSIFDRIEDDIKAENGFSNGTVKNRDSTDAQSQPSRLARKNIPTINLDSDGDDDSDSDNQKIKDDDSVIDVTPSFRPARPSRCDRDLVFPIYWTEAISPVTNKVIPVSPLVLDTPVASTPDVLSTFEPRGAQAERTRQVMAYVVGYSSDGTAKDVTVRYVRKQIWPGKTKPFRVQPEKVPIFDTKGRVKRHEEYDWFKDIMRVWARSPEKRTKSDEIEDSTDLVPKEAEKKNDDEGVDTLQSLKSSADFVLERFLRREEALRPGTQPVRMFAAKQGKGKNVTVQEEPVFKRSDVERCLTAESWHKEGRRPLPGETAMKLVPVRAVTLARKREAEEHEIRTGQKQMQGLYCWDQTEWIIPPPIKDGKIPKNSYGNMDCFVPSMVPKGAVHVPLNGTVRICKKLDIDYAEAVVGFEFGNKMAVPVISGVVVAVENEEMLRDAWGTWQEEQRIREEGKLQKLVLDLWRKFVLGLRIRERVRDAYGSNSTTDNDPQATSRVDHDGGTGSGKSRDNPISLEDEDYTGAGGFLPKGVAEEEDAALGGGFLLPHEDDVAPPEDLMMEDVDLHLSVKDRPHVNGDATQHEDQDHPVARAGLKETKKTDMVREQQKSQYPTPTSHIPNEDQTHNHGKTQKASKRRTTGIEPTDDGDDDDSDVDVSDTSTNASVPPTKDKQRQIVNVVIPSFTRKGCSAFKGVVKGVKASNGTRRSVTSHTTAAQELDSLSDDDDIEREEGVHTGSEENPDKESEIGDAIEDESDEDESYTPVSTKGRAKGTRGGKPLLTNSTSSRTRQTRQTQTRPEAQVQVSNRSVRSKIQARSRARTTKNEIQKAKRSRSTRGTKDVKSSGDEDEDGDEDSHDTKTKLDDDAAENANDSDGGSSMVHRVEHGFARERDNEKKSQNKKKRTEQVKTALTSPYFSPSPSSPSSRQKQKQK